LLAAAQRPIAFKTVFALSKTSEEECPFWNTAVKQISVNTGVYEDFVWPRDCDVEFVNLQQSLSIVLLLPALTCFGQATVPSTIDTASLPSSPSPQTSPAKVITLQDAVAMAEHNSPNLRGAQAATERSMAATRVARAYTNPVLEVYGGQQYARAVATPGIPGLLQHYAGYQAIEIPRERAARRRVAEFGNTASRFSQAAIARSITANAKQAFYNVLRSREELEHSQENLQIVEDLRRRVEVEVSVGEKGRLELTRAEAETAHASFLVRSAQLELAKSIALLRIAIAAPADLNLDPRGSIEPRLTLPVLAELREVVLRTHPIVGQSEAGVQQAEATLDRERALRIPQPTVFAEFENQPDLRFWRAGISIPLPLWDRRKGQIDESKAAISQARAERDQRRLELISATERAYEQYQLADQQAVSLESGELHAAESAVEAAQAAYRFGERGIVEVLDAQRVLQSVRRDLVEAQFDRQSALIDLEELGAIAPEGRP
jgi:cobalt-zinc-cadmium efflux system outer membrane protein